MKGFLRIAICLLVLMTLFFSVSCDENATASNSIIGTWIDGETDVDDTSTYTLILIEDERFVLLEGSDVFFGTYKLEGNTLSLLMTGKTLEFTYSLDSNKLNLYGTDSDNNKYTIVFTRA